MSRQSLANLTRWGAALLVAGLALSGCGGPGRADGRQVFESSGCGSCHSLAAAGTSGGVGPDLDQSLRGKSPDYVRRAILDPRAELEPGYGPLMPTNYRERLSAQQLDALVELLAGAGGR